MHRSVSGIQALDWSVQTLPNSNIQQANLYHYIPVVYTVSQIRSTDSNNTQTPRTILYPPIQGSIFGRAPRQGVDWCPVRPDNRAAESWSELERSQPVLYACSTSHHALRLFGKPHKRSRRKFRDYPSWSDDGQLDISFPPFA